ncbi:hypothetical protein ACQP2T_60945 [Nonomuraea sp. CA-143628]|uniref:hypothetical protein n=1 Tax=Nonomuraea sp. CA-143628 TaxID=3239997 RepID=UPI003D92A35C
MPALTMTVVEDSTRRPQRPHPNVVAREQAYSRLRDDWFAAHPGADDDAMLEDPVFVRAMNAIDGRDPNYGLDEA